MFIKGLLDLIWPLRCWACGRLTEEPICPSCFDQIKFITSPYCQKCGKPAYLETEACRACRSADYCFNSARSLGVFDGPLREAVHQFKYNNGRKLAPFFASLMVEWIGLPFWESDALTYVPLSRKKEFERGYNQAQLISEEIARLLEISCLSTLVINKPTQDQSKLDSAERRTNVRGAFSLHPCSDVAGKTVVLIDDVFTTGSTANECSKVLLKNGVAMVKVATIARAVNL